MDQPSPLSADELEERLDEHVDAALSSRRTAAGPARALAAFPRERQELVLRWVDVIARTQAEMAYQFAARAATALKCMEDDGSIEAWVIHAMDLFDKGGLPAGIAALQAVEEFASQRELRRRGASPWTRSGAFLRDSCAV